MENIYKLGERFADISEQYEDLRARIDARYEDNGGEITEETEQMEADLQRLESLRQEVVESVLSSPDEYAAIVKNTEAQKKILEAELKALKEEQAKACAKIEAKIKKRASKIEWFKQNIAAAMRMMEIEKIGGGKTDNRFCIYYQTTDSVATDEEVLLAPYRREIEHLVNTLPRWLTIKTDINKTEMKRVLKDDRESHPAGAALVENKTLQIK